MKILVVSGEYPPMKGGVGRYTHHLVHALREKKKEKNIEVHVAIDGFHRKVTTTTTTTRTSPTIANKISDSSSYNDTDKDDDNNVDHRIYYGVVKKGDRKNSDRLLDLIHQLKPDIVNIQYERGLYEVDTTVYHMVRKVLYGSTLDKGYKECPVPTVSTLHTVSPYDEYQEYIKERTLRKEGRLSYLPLAFRAAIRRWVMERRYDLLLEVVQLSYEIISPANTIHKIVKRGTVIYHGAEPSIQLLVHANNKQEFRKEFKLPDNKMLLLAFGHIGSYKGFDILDDISLPSGWSLVVKQNKHEHGVEQPVYIKN